MDMLAFEKVGDHRYRENFGLFYEDFEVGSIIEHYPGRTITEADNIWMSLLSLNTHPLHIDAVYGQNTEWGKNLVSSLVSLSIVGGLALRGTSGRGIANLGWDEIRMVAPLFVGETVFAETQILEKRESKSRPHQGIVRVKTFGKKSDGTFFMHFTRNFLVPLRSKKGSL